MYYLITKKKQNCKYNNVTNYTNKVLFCLYKRDNFLVWESNKNGVQKWRGLSEHHWNSPRRQPSHRHPPGQRF